MNHRVPPAPWRLTYADGSANVYRWWQDEPGGAVHFVYQPVKPEESSTGLYSGGPPRAEQLAAGDPRVEELWTTALALQADTARHAARRDKGTGAFTLTRGGEERFIVQRGESLEALSPLLNRFGVER